MHSDRRSRDADLIQPTVFLISDLLALELAFLLTYYIRFLTGWMLTPLGIPPFLPYLYTSFVLLLVWVGIFISQGLYDQTRRKSLEEDLDGLFRGVVVESLIVLAMAFFVRSVSYSRTFFVIFFVTSLLFLVVGRAVSRRLLRRYLRHGLGAVRVLFIGATTMRDRLLETFDRHPDLGLNAIGQLALEERSWPVGASVAERVQHEPPCLGTLEELEEVVEQHDIHLVLLTLPFERLSMITSIAERLGDRTIDVQFVPDMERIHAMRMRLREIAGVPFISVRDRGLTGMDRIVKRSFDIVVSSGLLLLLSPVLLVLALLVWLSSPGPILFRQERLGRDNRQFQMLKFRTMRENAEVDSGPVWTSENDPRKTAIGSFLRRFSLDELPQLLNVLRGDMSLVGPRPEREVFARRFHEDIPRYLARHRVRSGLTGWAQVHGLRGNTPIEVRTLYDLYYVENWSLGLDLRILLRTVVHVLRGENAY